jgi:hypothetical protein
LTVGGKFVIGQFFRGDTFSIDVFAKNFSGRFFADGLTVDKTFPADKHFAGFRHSVRKFFVDGFSWTTFLLTSKRKMTATFSQPTVEGGECAAANTSLLQAGGLFVRKVSCFSVILSPREARGRQWERAQVLIARLQQAQR